MIPLTNYCDLVHLDADDAIHHAAVLGITLNLYADPENPGREDVDEADAIEAAAVDPSLVYLTGACEQTGETTAAMQAKWANG